jgi:hypothetical protein
VGVAAQPLFSSSKSMKSSRTEQFGARERRKDSSNFGRGEIVRLERSSFGPDTVSRPA